MDGIRYEKIIIKKEKIRGKGNGSYLFEEKYGKVLREISCSTGKDPKDYLQQWIKNSDYALFYSEKGRIRAFMLYKFINSSVYYVPSLAVHSDYQGRSVSTKLSKKFIKEVLIFKLKSLFKNKGKSFFSFYFLFRTHNPKLYKILNEKISLFPNIENKFKPPESVLKIVKYQVGRMWPEATFCEKKYVLKNAYLKTPDLTANLEKIQWSNDSAVDALFEERLNLSQGTLDAMIIIGKLDKKIFFELFKKLFKKNKKI